MRVSQAQATQAAAVQGRHMPDVQAPVVAVESPFKRVSQKLIKRVVNIKPRDKVLRGFINIHI
jgi:hypothetical protein